MKLEKILNAGKSVLKNTLRAGLIGSMLYFSGCKKSDTTSNGSDKIVLSPNTVVLTDANLNEINYYDVYTIKFNPSSNSPVLKVGNFLDGGVSNLTPDGIIKKVTNVYDNGYSADLTDASLNDIVLSGKADFTIDNNNLVAIIPKEGKNSKIDYGWGVYFWDYVLYDLDKNPNTTNDQIRETGNMTFDPSMNLHFDFNKKTINFNVNFKTSARMELDAELTNYDFSKDSLISSFILKPIVFLLPSQPPLPVVILPEINIHAGVDGSVNAESKIVVEQTNSFNLGIMYDNGWSSSKTFTKDFTYDTPQATLNASVNSYLKLDAKLLLYGLLGPYFELKPYLDLEINTANNPWLDLYGGIESSIGLTKTSIGIGTDYSEELFDYKKTLLELSNNQTNNFTDPRDNHNYKTVQIGNQTWFAENLDYNAPGSHYYNDDANNSSYGRLYNWNTSQTVCPPGWHMPSDDEFKTLEKCLGMSQQEADAIGYNRGANQNVGTKLKQGGGSGFDALMAGERTSDGGYMNFGAYGYFWTSTMSDESGYPYSRILNQANAGVERDHYITQEAYFSERCIKDSK